MQTKKKLNDRQTIQSNTIQLSNKYKTKYKYSVYINMQYNYTIENRVNRYETKIQ